VDTNKDKQERVREKQKRIFPWSEKDKQEREKSKIEFFLGARRQAKMENP
jgi:hypothetical protein